MSSTSHLPHLLSSTLSLNLTKPSIQLVLAERVVFISPPFPRGYGFDESGEGKDVSFDSPLPSSRPMLTFASFSSISTRVSSLGSSTSYLRNVVSSKDLKSSYRERIV